MAMLEQRQASAADTPKPVSGRIGGVAGIIFFALYFVSVAILEGPISQGDSLDKVQRTFAAQADNVDIACALLLLSTPVLLVFATALSDVLGSHLHRGVAALVLPTAVAAAALTLASAALMGGTSFLAESATVDGRTAAFAHSASEAALFYATVLFGTLALAVAASSVGRLPNWYRLLATILGVGMIVGSAASPLVRQLALLAGLSTYVFFLVTGVMLVLRDWRRATT
jgi:hypothetical protein